MACSTCAQSRKVTRATEAAVPAPQLSSAEIKRGVVGKSDDPTKKVKLRYYGGGLTLQTTGCRSCGSQGKYALATTENISFASDDAPDGWFSQTFHVAHEYFVTEKQAEYLTSLVFRNKAGQVAHKFKRVD